MCRMQRNNNGTSHPACAACKHQRKKCSVNCILAPYFPASRNREFQAVHKIFGVSNITKLVKNARDDDRRRVVESLVWEAFCRQRDPILGPYGEYRKVYDEYKKLLQEFKVPKDDGQMLHLPSSQELKSVQDHVIAWNGSKGVETGLDFIHHHHHHHRSNGIMDSAIYGLDFSQDLPEVVINQFQQHHPPYYISGNHIYFQVGYISCIYNFISPSYMQESNDYIVSNLAFC